MTDELPWLEPDDSEDMRSAVVIEREPRPCKHPKWLRGTVDGVESCTSCGHSFDPVNQRRGRTSLRAGKDAERAIAKAYGGRRVGQYGGPDDVIVGDLFAVQSKASPSWFSERYWLELEKLPRTGGRIPTLVVSDKPGPGHRTRRLVIRTLDDDVSLHGELPR